MTPSTLDPIQQWVFRKLLDRGLVDEQGRLTERGAEVYRRIHRNGDATPRPVVEARPGPPHELLVALPTSATTTKEEEVMSESTISQRDEKILTQKVASLFKDGSVEQTAGVRYGRKLLKKKAGLRTSTPPMTGLTRSQGADVAKALGIDQRKTTNAKRKPKTAA